MKTIPVDMTGDWVTTTVHKLNRTLRRLETKAKNPKKYRSVRPLLMVPCLSLWVTRNFRPEWRWMKRDGSMLFVRFLFLVFMVQLPPWRSVDGTECCGTDQGLSDGVPESGGGTGSVT